MFALITPKKLSSSSPSTEAERLPGLRFATFPESAVAF